MYHFGVGSELAAAALENVHDELGDEVNYNVHKRESGGASLERRLFALAH